MLLIQELATVGSGVREHQSNSDECLTTRTMLMAYTTGLFILG